MLPSRSAPAPFYEKVKQEISEKLPAVSGSLTIAFRLRQNWWRSMVSAA